VKLTSGLVQGRRIGVIGIGHPIKAAAPSPKRACGLPGASLGLPWDLNQAAKIATREMLNFVVETKGVPRDDAFMLLSAAMDLHVTQIVDVTKGVHALLPKSIFAK
jgi:acetamidase/formamidase